MSEGSGGGGGGSEASSQVAEAPATATFRAYYTFGQYMQLAALAPDAPAPVLQMKILSFGHASATGTLSRRPIDTASPRS